MAAGDNRGFYGQILKYVKIRYRLLPYLYSTAYGVMAEDKTFMNALALAFEQDAQARSVKDEYLFGDQLLVAPIPEDNTYRRTVYLPTGTYSQSASSAIPSTSHKWGELLDG